jgi:hypothetical protein
MSLSFFLFLSFYFLLVSRLLLSLPMRPSRPDRSHVSDSSGTRQRWSRRVGPSPTINFNLAPAPHGRGGRLKTWGDGSSVRSSDGSSARGTSSGRRNCSGSSAWSGGGLGAQGADSGRRETKLLRCGR